MTETKEELFIVRLYDGGEHGWIDISKPVPKDEAQRIWNEHTHNGTRNTAYKDFDYYAIFPAGTKMLFEAGWTGIT